MPKQPTKKISANIPVLWMDMLDERAEREVISRTQAIKYAIRAYCFPKSKGKTTHGEGSIIKPTEGEIK